MVADGTIMNILLLALLVSTQVYSAERCTPQPQGEEVLYEQDFPWNQTLEQILEKAQEFYISPKRLSKRAYKNAKGEYVVPVRAGGDFKEAKLSPLFIKSVTLHIEEALKRKYVDAIHFADMGHSHFFVPEKFYNDVLDPIPVDQFHKLYERMLAHPELKILYHTAEQLVMKKDGVLLPDRHIQWRFFTRNLIGDNKGLGKLELLHNEEHDYNTAHDYDPGYKYWGGGYYIHANQNGCFPYNHDGKTYYFDINLDGINPKQEW